MRFRVRFRSSLSLPVIASGMFLRFQVPGIPITVYGLSGVEWGIVPCLSEYLAISDPSKYSFSRQSDSPSLLARVLFSGVA